MLRCVSTSRMVRYARALSALAYALLVLCSAHRAAAQDVVTTGTLTPATWARPNGQACPAPNTRRTYALYEFYATASGTFTVTVDRAQGTGVYLDVYQSFDEELPCQSRWMTGTNSTTARGSIQFSLAGLPAGQMAPFKILISGNSASDLANVTVTARGPSRPTPICNDLGVWIPERLTAQGDGGPLSARLVPTRAIGCPNTFTLSGSTWLSGFPNGGTGTTDVSFTAASNKTGMAREGTVATSAGNRLFVDQGPGTPCVYTVSPTSFENLPATVNTLQVSVTTAADCSWNVQEAGTWVSVSGGTGSGTAIISVAANRGPPRSTYVIVGNQRVGISQVGGCTVSASPTSVSVGPEGATRSFDVLTSSIFCSWFLSNGSSFLTNVTDDQGQGFTTVSYTVPANNGDQRTGALTVSPADSNTPRATHTVIQGSGCVFTLPSASEPFPAVGGSSNISMSTQSACSWTASSNASWVTPVVNNGQGSGDIGYHVAANVGPSRTAQVIIGGQVYTVTQRGGCTASLAPSSADLPIAGGQQRVALTLSAPSCPWTATTSESWISLGSTQGTGNASIAVTAASNSGAARSGNVMIGGDNPGAVPYRMPFTLRQAGTCNVSLPVAAAGAVAAGGDAQFSVQTAAGCAYTVTSDVPWLTPRLVPGGVGYTVSASNVDTRVGRLVVTSTSAASSQTFTVTQASGCAVALASSGVSVTSAGSSGSVAVTTGAGCSFSADVDQPWVSRVAVNGGSVEYTVDANPSIARNAIVRVRNASGARVDFALAQASGCTVAVTPNALSSTAAGGVQTFTVSSSSGCAPRARSNAAWLLNGAVQGDQGSFSVSPNDGPARQDVVRVSSVDDVANAELKVNQSAGCVLTLPIDGTTFEKVGGNGSFVVNAGLGCAIAASSAANWITNLSISAQTVMFSTTPNDGAARTALIDVRNSDTNTSATFAVSQAGGIVAPAIMIQPVNLTVLEGEPAQFAVVASGGELSYQWRKEGVAIPGATTMQLGIASAARSDAGGYDVRVSNAAGELVSARVTLTVTPRPVQDAGVESGTGPQLDASIDPSTAPPGTGPNNGGGGCAVGSRAGVGVELMLLLLACVSLRRRRRS